LLTDTRIVLLAIQIVLIQYIDEIGIIDVLWGVANKARRLAWGL
jgi:hypothetical protein